MSLPENVGHCSISRFLIDSSIFIFSIRMKNETQRSLKTHKDINLVAEAEGEFLELNRALSTVALRIRRSYDLEKVD